jgi:hypothetical protein
MIPMTRDQARELERNLTTRLREMGIIVDPHGRDIPRKYGEVSYTVDYVHRRGQRIPESERNYGVAVTTGMYRSSTPPKTRKVHHNLESAVSQIVREVNAQTETLTKRGFRLIEKAQKDFDRGWCAHRRNLTCKLINGTFHVLIRIGADEVWQDDVEYSTSHDTLVFKSEIGKVDRWITIETLQLLLDRGVLLNPVDVKFS